MIGRRGAIALPGCQQARRGGDSLGAMPMRGTTNYPGMMSRVAMIVMLGAVGAVEYGPSMRAAKRDGAAALGSIAFPSRV